MKTTILLMAMLAILPSCISQGTRDNALLPAMQLAWGGVRADLERGIDAAVEDGEIVDRSVVDGLVLQLDAALESGLRSDFQAVPWETVLLPLAERGITDRVDSGEMTDQVAESLRERLRNFTDGLGKLILVHIPMHSSPTPERWARNGDRITAGSWRALDGSTYDGSPVVMTR